MTKIELVEKVSVENGISKTEAKKIVESVLSNIKSGVLKYGKLQLLGFGTFKTQTRKARTGRNPSTGETIEIAEKTVVKFKPLF